MPKEQIKRKRGRPKKVRDEAPAFIGGPDLAYHFGITSQQLTKWIDQGHFPPPWARPGACTRLWQRSHWETFLATSKWPKEAWKGR